MFGTSNEAECIEIILRDGVYQETTEERREEAERKHKRLVYLINKNYYDPATNSPHPVQIFYFIKIFKVFKSIMHKFWQFFRFS